MEPIHARYPWRGESRQAVGEAGVDLSAVVAEDDAVVSRGVERVVWALEDGTVGDAHDVDRVELLSYPVARVLVSLVDEHVLTRKYAQAEATAARERFTTDFADTTELKSASKPRLTLPELLAEFDLSGPIRAVDGSVGDGSAVVSDGQSREFRVEVGTYLDLAADQRGDEWRLVNRALSDGEVLIDGEELVALLRQAVRHRVDDGLPLSVPDAIADELAAEAEGLRERLSELDLTRDIDTVVPELFPPCMKHLLDQVQQGEHLEHHSRFAIASFLTSIGMTTDEIVDIFQVNPGFGEEATRYQVDHIRGATSPTDYSPPACATMQSYGDCVGKDDICKEEINESHPLNYYEYQLDEAEEDDLTDWREAREEGEEDAEDGEGEDGASEDAENGEDENGGDEAEDGAAEDGNEAEPAEDAEA
ncbi:DNA primase regulatory subunit PriL [Halosimplex pelagicum]|uniref:DNA primase large subunit PriL n=1 Tax=Halosimplex pelagicum TaxID=869886 RepID=A0A7D5TWJ9_9EURY|nr:DNA primase regulatory subunit PriL [Halosimplex pelagicum]QLH84892.1 DNA primase regulatory subunit PriL [Halosimplex pelagicum]